MNLADFKKAVIEEVKKDFEGLDENDEDDKDMWENIQAEINDIRTSKGFEGVMETLREYEASNYEVAERLLGVLKRKDCKLLK